MVEFRYRLISERLVEELADLLAKGESLVLLGPRNVGKRYLIRRLRDWLAEEGRRGPGLASFLTGVSGEREAHSLAVDGRDAGDLERIEPNPAAVLDWVDARLRDDEGPITLFAANIDVLPHVDIRTFLYELRARIEGRGPGPSRLVVALTGEVDLRHFVYGPLSEFTSGNQYVIQGFDRPEFDRFARRYVEMLGPYVEPLDDELLAQLYERTGGNTYFLRLILWSEFDRRAGVADLPGRPFSLRDIPDALISNQPPWNHYLRYITRLIDDDPESWADLERLIKGEALPVLPRDRLHGSPHARGPHPLELAGIALRRDGRLTMPATLVRDYIERHYTARRFADLYAREVSWAEALKRYRDHVSPEQRRRPSGLEDVLDAEDVVKNLRTSLYREATLGPQEVLRRFCDGCRYVMGFDEVTHWQFVGRWEPVIEPASAEAESGPIFDAPAADLDDAYRTLLDAIPRQGPPGRVEIDSEYEACVLALRIPTRHPDESEVVLVGRPGVQTFLSEARKRMSRHLAGDFVTAYDHALADQRGGDRLKFLGAFSKVVDEIVNQLGTEIRDVRDALKRAAQLLRELGYSRVIISVIDPARRRIVPVAIESDPRLPPVPQLNDYSYELDDPQPTGCLWVIKRREPLISCDACEDDRVRREVARRFEIHATAIIPLIDPEGEVAGTVQIERTDGLRPIEEEVGDLLDFGRKLAVALQLNEQVAMLQTALDTLPEPIAIFGKGGLLRYANKHAGERIGVEAKWFRPGLGPHYVSFVTNSEDRGYLKVFEPMLRQTLRTCERIQERCVVELEGRSWYLDILVGPIWDWRGDLVSGPDHLLEREQALAGVLFRARDVSYLSCTLQALHRLLTANSVAEVIDRTAEVTHHLGHRWGRLYMVPEDDRSCMVSKVAFGIDDPELERRFREGNFRITSGDDASWEGWHCILQGRPVVFFHDPNLEDRAVRPTKSGLRAVNCRDPRSPPELCSEPGQYWVDFPLVTTSERPFGKLTLECAPARSPEDIRILEILRELTSTLLEEMLRRQSERDRRDQLAVEARSRILHDISGNLSQLPHLLFRQRQLIDRLRGRLAANSCTGPYEGFFEAIAHVENRALGIHNRINDMIDEEKQRSVAGDLRIKRVDLVELIRGMLPIDDELVRVRLEGPVPESCEIDLDSVLFRAALEEMIRNAGRFPKGEPPVLVSLRIEGYEVDGDARMRVLVADNGTSVPSEIRDRIFERNFSTDPECHTGKGLSDIKAMIERHGGTISLDHDHVEGALFLIDLPRDDASRERSGSPLPPKLVRD